MTEALLKFFGARRRGVVVTDPAGNPTVVPYGAVATYFGSDGGFSTPPGAGDVVGPAGATADRIAVYNGTTGKIIKDGGKTIATVLSDAASAAATAITSAIAALSFAPVGAQYVALVANATLTNERVLAGTANQIVVADSGAGAAVTLSTPQNIHTGATPQFGRLGLGAAADAAAGLKVVGQAFSPLVADGNSGTAKTIDWNAGNEHLLTLTGNVTLTLSNPVDGGRYVLVFDTGAGAFTVAWPGTVKWAAGTTPTITVTAAKYDLVTLIWLNTAGIYLAVISQNHG